MMTTKAQYEEQLMKVGGFAFPGEIDLPEGGVLKSAGMSMRDWFAGHAITAMIQNNQLLGDIAALNKQTNMVAAIAHHSYAIADAMLAERSRK